MHQLVNKDFDSIKMQGTTVKNIDTYTDSSSPGNLQLFDPDEDGGTVLRNIVNCTTIDKVLRSPVLESSVKPM